MGKPLTLLFDPFESIVLFLAVLTVNYVVQDGKSNWLEGMILMCKSFLPVHVQDIGPNGICCRSLRDHRRRILVLPRLRSCRCSCVVHHMSSSLAFFSVPTLFLRLQQSPVPSPVFSFPRRTRNILHQRRLAQFRLKSIHGQPLFGSLSPFGALPGRSTSLIRQIDRSVLLIFMLLLGSLDRIPPFFLAS